MTMQRQNLTRVFLYAGVRLPDPDASISPIAVRDLYAAASRPELSNAEVRGPELVGNEMQFTLHRAVGTKGLSKANLERLAAQFAEEVKTLKKAPLQVVSAESKQLLAQITADGGAPMALPSVATPWLL